MANLERQVQQYVTETLGVPTLTVPWDGADRLPAYLTGKYQFARAEMLGRRLLLLLDE